MARPNQGSNGLIWFPPASSAGLQADPYSSNLVLALPFNEKCGLANQAGVGSVGRSSVKTRLMRGVTISSAQSKFYGSSAYFSGSGQHVLQFAGNDLEMGNGDFTIEAWLYHTALGNAPGGYYRRLLATGENASNAIQIVTDGANSFGYSPQAGPGAFYTPSLNTWYHLAISRQGSTVRVFKDGVLAQTFADSDNKNHVRDGQAGVLWIGLYPDLQSGEFAGYINDLRVYKGVAKYTANFAPPAAIYSSSTSSVAGLISTANAVSATVQTGATALAYGGKVHDVIYLGDKYRVHQFDTVGSSTFEVAAGGNFEVLVVAGGGGGGQWYSGGAGAGGVIHHPSLALSAGNYALTVGAAGTGQAAGAPSDYYPVNSGLDGNDSSFGSIIVAKGGGGGPGYNSPSPGRSGGSGSGGRSGSSTSGGAPVAGTVPAGGTHYGNAGGNGTAQYAAGGGGGAGGVGSNSSGNTGGRGGPGRVFEITGEPIYYAAGGGGGGYGVTEAGAPGLGGGGRGSHQSRAYNAVSFGSGGGSTQGDGSSHNSYRGGDGRQGVIIIRYRI